jgi:hypothetical protein
VFESPSQHLGHFTQALAMQNHLAEVEMDSLLVSVSKGQTPLGLFSFFGVSSKEFNK